MSSDKYIIQSMKNVVICSIDGIDFSSPGEQVKIEAVVEKKVKEVVQQLKANHSKFEDPDFGPNEKDEYGAISLYGNCKPDPAGSKYPSPESLRWERPQYADDKFRKEANLDADTVDGEEDDDEDEDEDEDDMFASFGGENKVCFSQLSSIL